MTSRLSLVPEKVLRCINLVRRKYGVPDVVWDPVVAKYAQEWADNGKFQHRMNNRYGENIAVTYSEDDDMRSAIEMFEAESKKYDWSHPGYQSSTGHFTALVWKSSKRIGGGAAKLPNGSTMYVLNFDPPGNIVNSDMRYFRQNVLKKKS